MTIDVSLELLDGVYPLPHRQPKYLQCEGFCDRYLDLFSSILSPIWVRILPSDLAVLIQDAHRYSLRF
jgi:hypothetical protein